jgi:hypothetical protein
MSKHTRNPRYDSLHFLPLTHTNLSNTHNDRYYAIPTDISTVAVEGLGGVRYADKLDAAGGDKTGAPSFPIAREHDPNPFLPF